MKDSIDRGKIAERILDDEVFKNAVSDYSKALVREWEVATKTERREELWQQMNALKSVVSNLGGYMQNAKWDLQSRTKKGMFK